MKRLTLVVLALFCGLGASAAVETGTSRAGLPFWKPVGRWIVLLLPLANGAYGCTALARSDPNAKYSVAFVLTASSTHLYLDDPALSDPPPSTLELAVDGHSLARVQVLLQEPFDKGRQLLVADLPGAMLAREVLPAMLGGQKLEVTAGGRHYTVSVVDFPSVLRELQDCARTALGLEPLLSSK